MDSLFPPSSSSSPSPSSFPNLNLSLQLTLTHDQCPPVLHRSYTLPNPHLSLTLSEEEEEEEEEDPFFSELPIVPLPDQCTELVKIPRKKYHQRSSEMVRIPCFTPEDEIPFRGFVRQTRITYESIRHYLRKEEKLMCLEGARRTRPDAKAASLMMEKGMWLNRAHRIIGSIPGISVGDVFFFRIELCVLGLHGHTQAGIDYISASRSQNGEPIATSIISSGGYEDDEDSGEVLIYTGHGGRIQNLTRQYLHQKLERGNLAMERSMFYGIEIRVIRGLNCNQSPTGRLYVYDGLYRIESCWLDIGISGFCVYKYKLVRIPGQPEMGSSVIKFVQDLKLNPTSRSGYFNVDISMGREKMPVSLFNDVDGDIGPSFFEYLVSPVYPQQSLISQNNGDGCDCLGGCMAGVCFCVELNDGEFPYDGKGILTRGKPVIYECGRNCHCPPSCQNRLTQKGINYRLEVFRSKDGGWGVRSLDLIEAGAFICEFTGVIRTRQQAYLLSMSGNNLVYASQFPNRWAEWGNVSEVFPEVSSPGYSSLPPVSFALDVSRMRNVAAYFTHSSVPNVMVQFLLYCHEDPLYPHLMLFATENIPPMRELTIDYGEFNNECEAKPLLLTYS